MPVRRPGPTRAVVSAKVLLPSLPECTFALHDSFRIAMLPCAAHCLVVLAFCWLGLAPVGARAQALPGTFAGGVGHSLSIQADGTWWAVDNNKCGQPGTGIGPG